MYIRIARRTSGNLEPEIVVLVHRNGTTMVDYCINGVITTHYYSIIIIT